MAVLCLRCGKRWKFTHWAKRDHTFNPVLTPPMFWQIASTVNLKLEVRVPRWMALHGFDFSHNPIEEGFYMSFYCFTFSPKKKLLFQIQYAFGPARKSRDLYSDSQGDVVGVRRRIGDWLELVQDVWWPWRVVCLELSYVNSLNWQGWIRWNRKVRMNMSKLYTPLRKWTPNCPNYPQTSDTWRVEVVERAVWDDVTSMCVYIYIFIFIYIYICIYVYVCLMYFICICLHAHDKGGVQFASD